MRCAAFLVGLTLAWPGLPPSARAGDNFEIRVPGKGSLGVVDGKVYFVDPPQRAGCRDWRLVLEDGFPQDIITMGGKWVGWYLTADPKTGGVRLCKKQGRGLKWKLTTKELTELAFTVQAAEGKFKGCYLEVEERGLRRGKGKGRYTLYRVKLAKKPGPNSKMRFTVVAH